MQVAILDNFATVGLPDFEGGSSSTWNIVAISNNLIPQNKLAGLQRLNTRKLDLVIKNGEKFALLNLEAFKMFEASHATENIQKCLNHHLTSDGNGSLLFGLQSSGDVIVLTDSLKTIKTIRQPYYIKLQKQPRLLGRISRTVQNIVEFFTGSNNQVFPSDPSSQTNGSEVNWLSSVPEHCRHIFPYLNSSPDGFVLLCCFNPTDCYVFLSSYETALRSRTIANCRDAQIPGRWYRILMHKEFLCKWLEDKDKRDITYEANINNTSDKNNNLTVGGTMVYAAFKDLKLELNYGQIKGDQRFTLDWYIMKYELDWVIGDLGSPISPDSRFVTRLSSDGSKIAIVVSTHLGFYVYVQQLPSLFHEDPIKLERQVVPMCNHGHHDGTVFYNKECWIADVQWLVEDAYFSCITLCGCLSIFRACGSPMVLKVRKPRAGLDESKSAKFYYQVFHRQQISASQSTQVYPCLKWVDAERVITCSSGMKIELLSFFRVLPLPEDDLYTKTELKDRQANKLNITRPKTSQYDTVNSNKRQAPEVVLSFKDEDILNQNLIAENPRPDTSSEDDNKALPLPAMRVCLSLPDLDANFSLRKKSQVYLADDELSDGGIEKDSLSTQTFAKRKFLSKTKADRPTTTGVELNIEPQNHYPSSPKPDVTNTCFEYYKDTDGTYSSPFSSPTDS